MANFVGPVKTTAGYQLFINADLVTDFLYDEEEDVTAVSIVGEDACRKYPGNLTEKFFPVWRRNYE